MAKTIKSLEKAYPYKLGTIQTISTWYNEISFQQSMKKEKPLEGIRTSKLKR